MKKTCIRDGCRKEFEVNSKTIQYYCSKRCRLLARGSRKGKKLATYMAV